MRRFRMAHGGGSTDASQETTATSAHFRTVLDTISTAVYGQGDVCGRNNVVSFHNKLGSTGRASRRGQVVSDYPLR